MRGWHSLIIILLLVSGPVLQAASVDIKAAPERVQVISSNAVATRLDFNLSEIESHPQTWDGVNYESFTLPGEGSTYEYGKPLLPAVSRFAVVPPEAGLAFEFTVGSQERISLDHPPLPCLDEGLVLPPTRPIIGVSEVYPANIAEMSDPFIIRGVRMVKITTYPLQYDPDSQILIHNLNITTDIRFTDEAPLNPVRNPVRTHRSREFLKVFPALAINGDIVGRDDPDRDQEPEYIGHYLIVTHQSCLQYAQEFIHWRRKAGYRVDIISLAAGDAANPGTVKNRIQAAYDALVNANPPQDPFDYILLIGDIQRYDNIGVNGNWILDCDRGNTIWGGGCNHADYTYACLEGNDTQMDVGISRWASGSDVMMGLTVGRTMAYEANPYMQNTDWFGRSGVFSQHWGNGEASAWHVTVNTNVRWAEEVFQFLGFNDVRFYERYEWDQNGAVIGPWMRDLINARVNVLAGRAENYFWRSNYQGVNDNVVFPIQLNVSGHGEWSAWCAWRGHADGGPNHLKGPVALTFGWGGPPTAPNSAFWLELVNNVMLRDIPFGIGYTAALNAIERLFPNFNWAGQPLYLHNKTDINAYGDPGIQPWIGVPRVVTATYPQTVTAQTKQILVTVRQQNNNQLVAGARVTFYAPTDNPDFTGTDESFRRLTFTDENGAAHIVFDPDEQIPGRSAFVTVTGRDIRPFFGDVQVSAAMAAVDLMIYELTEVEGNDNGEINPGENYS
ncbi:MAG: C25 family cysteine peptidase, partial [Calditrichota bacterium]